LGPGNAEVAPQTQQPVQDSLAERSALRTLRLPPFRRIRTTIESDAHITEGRLSTAAADRDARYRRSLALADTVAAGLAVLLGVNLLGDDTLSLNILIALPVIVLVSKTVGLYDRDEHLLRKTTLDEVPRLFHVATLYALGLWLLEHQLVGGQLGKEQILGVWGLLLASMVAARTAVRMLSRHSSAEERCLVLGDRGVEDHLARKFCLCHSLKATVVGRVPLEDERRGDARGDAQALGSLDHLEEVLVAHDIQRVIIAPRSAESERILDAVRLLKSFGVKVSVLPRLFEVVGSSVEFDDVEGTVVLGLKRHGLTHSSGALKRATDVIGASIMVLLLAPFLIAIAVAVKISSPGPVLFRQGRVGRGGHAFQMLKFRTMVEGAEERQHELRSLNEAEGLFKIADDPRVTRVGRFLRRTSLDELPQLLNVLRGDMSLVGPRPLVLEEDELVKGWQRRRLLSPPGMTGLWQIFGSSRIPLDEMVKIDYLYGANWSLWMDTKILLRTIPYVLGRRGM